MYTWKKMEVVVWRTVKKKLFSPQWWRRFCLSLVFRESATGQQLLYRPVFLFHALACVCSFRLMSRSVGVSALSFDTLVSFWFWLLTASHPQRFPTSATSSASLLHPTSPGMQQLMDRWWPRMHAPFKNKVTKCSKDLKPTDKIYIYIFKNLIKIRTNLIYEINKCNKSINTTKTI